MQGLSMSIFHFTPHLSHLHIPVIMLIISPLFHPTLTKPSVIPLTNPIPPEIPQSSETVALNTIDATNNFSVIDNLRSLRSVLIICWRDTVTGMRNNINANSTDKSFKSWNKGSIEGLKDCLMARALTMFDRAVSRDVIEVVPGWMKLVRYRRDDVEGSSSGAWRKSKSSDSEERQIFDWRLILLRRLLRLLRNHHLEINLNAHRDRDHDMEGRRRHHFMPMLVFGAITSSIIAIPMMFQFLSVLGGKALLLAKLALILTAIQGLKKVATSNFNYGLYNTPGHNPWQQYDRNHYFDMNLDYTPPGAGLANPYAEHFDNLNNNNNGFGNIPERNYIPDYQQVLRPRSTIDTNAEE